MTVDAFLAAAGWDGAERIPMAGDASTRRYDRLTRGAERAVLLQSGRDDATRFADVTARLQETGLAPPRILADGSGEGLLLLEDLGDDLLTDRATPETYAAATEVVLRLRGGRAGGLRVLDGPALAGITELAWTHYAGRGGPAPWIGALTDALDRNAGGTDCLVLFDYHAGNLIWQGERSGTDRVRLLDYQDAGGGPEGYDLLSLIEDARRDVPDALREAAIRTWLDGTGGTAAALDARLAVLGAVKHLRVIGIFARLCLEGGKPHYLRHLPRLHAYLDRALSQGALREVAPLVDLPPSTPAYLSGLEVRCAPT